MKNLFSKAMEFIMVIASLIVAFIVFKSLDMERFIKPDATPVTAAQIAASTQENYTGKTAGADITRLTDISDMEKMTWVDYATVETTEVIPTGIYELKPWVDPYEITKARNSRGRLVSTGRRAPEVTDSEIMSVEYYQEYYLVKLPDETYILAQCSDIYRDRAAAGTVTLPIGKKKANSNSAKQYLAEICDKYGADNAVALYMIDDEWQESHELSFFMIKLGIAVVVFFLLAVSMFLVFYKIKDKQ